MKNPRRCSGFSLVEAIMAIVVMSLLITPTVAMLRDSTSARMDATQETRASVLATAVLEQVQADVASPNGSLGMAALASSSTYLNTASTGLIARMSGVTSAYSALGMSWSLSIGGLVGYDGVATGNSLRDVYRSITVTITWTSVRTGSARSYVVNQLVTDLTP